MAYMLQNLVLVASITVIHKLLDATVHLEPEERLVPSDARM